MTNEPLKIYTDQGTAVNPSFKGLELTSYSCKPVRMGFADFQAEVVCKDNLDNEWTGREYVTFRGERFYIRKTPSAKYDNTSFLWKHSCTLVSESAEILGNVFFYDAVYSYASTKDKPCSNSTKVTFYGNIYEICDRINCSLKYRGIGDSILNTKMSLTTEDEPVGDGFCVMTDPYGDYDRETSWEFSFEDKNIWEVLTEVVSKTEIPFEKRGKKFIFGAVPKVVEHVFEQGFDKALLSVNHQNANAKVINNITMVGSSDNIPHYYPNETEYGHISVDCTGNTHITADKVEIVNMNQFLSKISPDKKAELWYKPRVPEETPITEITTNFGDDIDWNDYTLGDKIIYEYESGHTKSIPWHIKIKFNVNKAGPYALNKLTGMISHIFTLIPNEVYVDLAHDMMSGVKFLSLFRYKDGAMITDGIETRDGVLYLGNLEVSLYVLDISIDIFNPIIYYYLITVCKIDEIIITGSESAGSSDYGFQWKIGEKSYKTGQLGLKISEDFTEEMLGEKIGWTASDRMEFQSALMPPKYRQTLGTERFYKALNNTYTDPDTNDKYTFPNPFVEGAPVEHIYRNDKIKPTITGIENSTGALLGEVADVSYDLNDNDALRPAGESSGSEDDTSESLTYQHSFFYIRLNKFDGPFGFNLFKHASQNDPMTIQMTSGACAGCKFKVQAVEFEDSTGLKSYKNPVQTVDENGQIVIGDYERKVSRNNLQEWQQDTSTHSVWICLQKDTDTFGQILPSYTKGMTVKAHDTFNIINIDLPAPYILAAEKRLEDEGIRYMSDNNEEKFTFDIKASRIFFAENPDVLSTLDEYSVIKIKYEGVEYEQYVSGLTISVKAGEALPDIGITLTDTLSGGKGFEQRVAERAATLIANGYTAGGYIGGAGGGMSTSLADKRYINKQKNDRTRHKLSSDVGFEIGEFVSGNQGGIFYIDPNTGRSYIEVDEMRVRLKAMFEEIQVAKLDSIGGEMGVTPGGSVRITFVEERADCYRCFFKGKDLSEGAECRFHFGDQVQCKTDNISNGLTQNASNRYWWRLVTAIDNERCYFDLSKTDYDTASTDIPQGGDTAMQLGSRTDPKRRSAIIMSTINENAPSVILYNGIDSYSLNNKAVVEYGVDKTKNPPEPFFHCYGSFYFGPRDRKTYLEYDAATGDLIFNGILNVGTKVGSQVLEDYIKSVSPSVEQEDIEDFVNNIVNPKLESLQNQIDGVVETWFYNGVPTLTNHPASEWTTEALKIAHLGDLYYDNDTGTAYRFSQDEQGTYFWNTITDDAITKALAAAQKAQDTADGKRRVFTAQPTAQQVYDVGDLWVNATYGTQYSDDLLRCVTHKDAGAAFNIAHWTLASKYTDDSALNDFINDYNDTIADIKTQIDGKAETWYQSTNPAAAWTTAADKTAHKGDLWYCTADITGTDFKKGTTWYWSGTEWVKQDIPQSVFDTIDGKAEIFVSKPTDGYKKNDLWFLEAPYTLKDNTEYAAGTLVVAVADMGFAWSAADWTKKDRYTDDTYARTVYDTYSYLKSALEQDTTVTKGLIMTSLVSLGYVDSDKKRHTMAGMNGMWIPNYGPRTIASWWGGEMIDRFGANGTLLNQVPDNAATALVRMDGSAYWASGNIQFRANGTAQFGLDDSAITIGADGHLTIGNGISINIGGNAQVLGESIASVTELANKLSHLFTPYLGNSAKSWASIKTLSDYDSIKVNKSIWTDGFISARGLNANGGSGGGSGSGKSYLSDLLDVDLSALSSGQVLTWNGTKWVNSALTLPDMAGYALESWVEANYYTKDEVNAKNYIKAIDCFKTTEWNEIRSTSDSMTMRAFDVYGEEAGGPYITGNVLEIVGRYNHWQPQLWFDGEKGGRIRHRNKTYNDNTWGDWYILLDTHNYASVLDTAYVKKIGDTMTGSFTIRSANNGLINLNTTNASEVGMRFLISNDSKGWAGYHPTYGTNLFNYQCGKYLAINDSGVPNLSGSTIWHAGNDGSGSGLDADLLDGKHLTDILASNVASATKLKTARSIWGQSFDGSGNVSGNMSGVRNIIADSYYIANSLTNPYLRLYLNSKYWYVQAFNDKLFVGAGVASSMQIDSTGNVGIGLASTTNPTAKLDVAGLVKASSGIQIASTADIGWYSNNSRLCAGNLKARGVNVGSLLVSDAWADATKVPTNGIYSKGEIISSNINAFRAISGNYGAIIRNDGEHLYFLLTNSNDQYGSFNGLRPLYINLATGLVKMQQGLQIGGCTISWDAANNMLKFDKGLYSEGGVSARGINTNAGGTGSGKSYLSDLLDVDLGTLSSGQVLTWNGTKWVNSALTLPDMAGYALESWVEANYYTKDEVNAKNYIKAIDCFKTTEWNEIRSTSDSMTMRAFDVYGEEAGGPYITGNVLEIVGRYNHWQPQLWFDGEKGGRIRHRNKTYNDNTWGDWYILLDTHNYASVLDTAYVKKIGDTMTGSFTIRSANNGLINLNTTNASEVGMRFLISNDSKGWAGYHPTYGTNLFNYQCGKYLAINDSGVPNLSGSTIWHAGNDGSGSGLDADLLDGKHLTDILASNVASATKLKTARSIWGQSFDGSGNVSGNMSGVRNIIADSYYIANSLTNPYLRLYLNSKYWYVQAFNDKLFVGAGVASSMQIDSTGNVGIGLASTTNPTAKLDVAGLVKASSGIQIASTADIGWYSNNSRLCAGNLKARGVNVGSLLVSDAWADATKVPTNGIYSKGEIISSNINAFRAISGNYGAIIRNDGEHLYFLLTNSNDQYGSFNGLRPLYINLATGLVKMQQGLQIGGCTISWDAANNMLKFDKGLYSEGPVSARGVNASGSTGSGSGNYLQINGDNATDATLPHLFQKLYEYDSALIDGDFMFVSDEQSQLEYGWRITMLQLWNYIKSKMGLAFTVDGDNVNIGCQPGKLTLNGVTINAGSAVTCNSLTAQGVTIVGSSADSVKIKYQGKTYTLQLAKLIQAGYLTQS